MQLYAGLSDFSLFSLQGPIKISRRALKWIANYQQIHAAGFRFLEKHSTKIEMVLVWFMFGFNRC
jgi:hypothetical protein